MTRNEVAINDLIAALDDNVVICEHLQRDRDLMFAGQMVPRRRRAAASLRAVLMWYGAPADAQPCETLTGRQWTLFHFQQAQKKLERLYRVALMIAGDNAPESRLLREQLQTARNEGDFIDDFLNSTVHETSLTGT